MNKIGQNVRERQKQELLLEKAIEGLEKQLADKYYQLGKGVYEAVERRIGEINGLVDRLVEERIRLTQTRGQVVCSHCLAPNPQENRFCGKCGKALEGDKS